MAYKAIILAGGKGLRYAEGDVPKTLQFLEGKPIVTYSIDSLKEIGLKNEDITVITGGDFADETVGFLKREYNGINVGNYDKEYIERAKLGSIAKTWKIANCISGMLHHCFDIFNEDRLDDIVMCINADSIYPKRALKNAFELSERTFDKYDKKREENIGINEGNSRKRCSGLVYSLKTPHPGEIAAPIYCDEEPPFHYSAKVYDWTKRFINVKNKVVGFEKKENGSYDPAIFTFKAIDLYDTICTFQEDGRHPVPVIDGLDVNEDELHDIYAVENNRDGYERYELWESIDKIEEVLTRNNIKVRINRKKLGEETDNFDELLKFRNRLVKRFEREVGYKHLKSGFGTGLKWICNQMVKEGHDILGVESDTVYFNLNHLIEREEAKKVLRLFSHLVKSKDRAEPYERCDYLNDKDEDDIDSISFFSGEAGLLAEAIKWDVPIDLEYIFEYVGDKYREIIHKKEPPHAYVPYAVLKCVEERFRGSSAKMIENYLMQERAKDVVDFFLVKKPRSWLLRADEHD